MNKTNSDSKAKSGNLRQFILIGVLALLVIGLIYDYRVARPAVNQAYDKIIEQSALVNSRSTEKFTNLNVQELLNKQPSRTFEEPNGDYVEVYSWRSGLPIRTHDLFAVYKKNGDDWLFHRHAKFKHEASTEVSKFDTKVHQTVQIDENLTLDAEAEAGYGDDGPETSSGGSGGPGGGAGGGRNFDPEAMFAEQDADGDGTLSGDEISDRMRANLSETDTDGDGAISKEEWDARIEAMRGRFGAGGGGGRPGAGSPPEAEAETEQADAETSSEQ